MTADEARDWEGLLRRKSVSRNRQDNFDYCYLVEAEANSTDREVIKTLMRSFTWGVPASMQQTVVRTLGSICFELYYECLTELAEELGNNNSDVIVELLDYPGRVMSKNDVLRASKIISRDLMAAKSIVNAIKLDEDGTQYPWAAIYNSVCLDGSLLDGDVK